MIAAVCCGLTVSAGVAVAATPAVPIESTGPKPTLPAFIGKAAKSDPVPGVKPAWQNPFMASNPGNSVHNDSWQSDNYTQLSGPLGHHLKTLSTAIGRDCITLSFDRHGQLIGSCSDLTHGPGLYLLNPKTLATLAFMQLPYVPPPKGTDPATNTTGGAYFYLDNHGRVVIAASNKHVLVVALKHVGGKPVFKEVADYDPTPCLTPGDRIPSVLPDTEGRLWFVGRYDGAVGVLNPSTGQVPLGDPARADRELVRDRQGWRLHRHRQGHVQVPGRPDPDAHTRSGAGSTATAASRSPARSTPDRGRRRP